MKRSRRSRIGVVLAGAAVVATVAGCGKTIEGTALPAGASGGNHPEFTKLLTECDAVTDDQIAEAVQADAVERGFFGAICRWDGSGPSGRIKITFNWFETGTLEVERSTNQQLGYQIDDITVEGRRALQLRRPNDPDSCGVTAGAPDQGVIGWWVQYRPGSAHPDPCAAAGELASLTLNLSR
ncbi:MAG: DUF3558 domain-containing protein [Aldersonia sp.]|jgi:hypothetical protein|nr:DUF3558 domain-containing protein [Aldersonia sp.]